MRDDEMLEAYNTAVDAAMDRACERDGFASNTSRESRVAGLRAVERAAAARALEEAADGIESRRNEPGLVHLDVRYAGYYTGIRSGMESDSKALRVRAAEIREGKNDE